MVVQGLAHLLLAVQTDNQRVFGEVGLGFREDLTVTVVEAPHDLPGQFQVRYLVLSHWDGVGLVQDDVGGLQDGISHQTVIDAVLSLAHLADFVLEGGHPHEPP